MKSILFVDQAHQVQILLTLLTRDVVHRGAAQAEQFPLAYKADLGMTTLDYR